MVIKTEVCAFTEARIYPGHGIRFARRDGQLVTFATSKAKSMYHQKKKAPKLVWTYTWRRLHKKGIASASSKKRSRRSKKVARTYAAMSTDAVAAKRKAGPRVVRKGGAASKKAIAEAKARAKK
mmetsp:Transcript_7843/g.11840  ORF Transcript_7843/g.11840 Transcript_7843/m.11840 type:complete len:124 (-) Transcript_7843:34-405(-)